MPTSSTAVEAENDELALFPYTSGSTGRPKPSVGARDARHAGAATGPARSNNGGTNRASAVVQRHVYRRGVAQCEDSKPQVSEEMGRPVTFVFSCQATVYG